MSRSAAAECILFVAGEPIPTSVLAQALLCPEEEALEALEELASRLDATQSGLQVISIAGGYQLATRPGYAESIGRLVTRPDTRLSRAALETAAIIAYRQPITLPEVEAVRGVSCSGVIKTLVDRRLVAEAGRKQTVGRPILYETTPEFLHYFALGSLADLPPIEPAEAPSEAPTS